MIFSQSKLEQILEHKLFPSFKGIKIADSSIMKRFFLSYLAWSLLFYVFIRSTLFKSGFDLEYQYNNFTALTGAAIINRLGIQADAVANTINIPHGTLQVLFGCSGLESIVIYTAALLSFSNPNLLQKSLWLFYGIGFLYFLNLLRIYLLAYVREFHIESFRVVHDYISQGLFIVVALIVFLIYLSRIKHVA